MSFVELFFFMFAGVTLFAALSVIFTPNPVKAVFFLVLAFVSSAGVWLLLQSEFLAIILILVYVGAVIILFLFVVMMLDPNLSSVKEKSTRYWFLSGVIAVIISSELFLLLSDQHFDNSLGITLGHSVVVSNNTEQIGKLLFTEYLYSFELAAMALLIAMVLALVLTLGNTRQTETRYTDTRKQVQANKSNRLVMIRDQEQPADPEKNSASQQTSKETDAL